MKKNTKKQINVQLNKKDSNELFTGKYKTQIFADKKDKLDKIIKKEQQKKYPNEDI